MKLVLIDDHPLIRKGLKSLFSLDQQLDVLGEATNGQEALSLLMNTDPDIAIIDLRLGEESGINVIQQAKQQGVHCKFAILTSSTTEADFLQAKEVGVDGYILKEALPEELLHALHMVYRGRKYYDPTVLDLVMESSSIAEENQVIDQLTPKEKEVLIELGKGRSNKEISQTLFITEYTVKKHVSQIFSKLGLADRTQAALYANAKGLVKYVVHE